MKYFIHSVPGKFRIKIPSLKHQPAKEKEMRHILTMDGIESVKVNAVTGSLVVAHDADRVQSEHILNVLTDHNLFDADKVMLSNHQSDIADSKVGQKLGKAFFGRAVGKALEANGISLLAAFI